MIHEAPYKCKKEVDALFTFLERADPNLFKKINLEFWTGAVETFEMAPARNFNLMKEI
jgi:hypothetical protein